MISSQNEAQARISMIFTVVFVSSLVLWPRDERQAGAYQPYARQAAAQLSNEGRNGRGQPTQCFYQRLLAACLDQARSGG